MTADVGAAPIPLVDLLAQDREVRVEIEQGFRQVMDSGAFVQGPEVGAFERAFAAACGVCCCVGVGNGTDALELALRAVGIERGAEVILPVNSFVATAEAVVRAGAVPKLVDVDPTYGLLDLGATAAAIGPRTGAIVPVHLYGQMAPMERLAELANRAGLALVEDAAQAHGSLQDGAGPGSRSAAAATSFYPAKNLGAYGDAGAVLTSREEVAARVRRLGNHGSERPYEHRDLGTNSRLDSLQAVVLSAKLRRLPAWNNARRSAARRYEELLGSLEGVTLPSTVPGNTNVWHLYVIRLAGRDAVLQRLRAAGIAAAIHYPVPIHLHPAFGYLGHARGEFPVAETAADRILSLPLYPHISAAQQAQVALELRRALS